MILSHHGSMETSAPWGQRTAQAQVCPRNTNISLLSCSILRFTKMTLSREMKKSRKGKRKENQWKQREYKYTENHAQALHKFYSYIPNLAVLSISQSRIQKVDIHKHKLCIFFFRRSCCYRNSLGNSICLSHPV